MANDPKKPDDGIILHGKTLDELTDEELNDGFSKGELELPENAPPKAEDVFTLERLEKFILGDITWAQLTGMTVDEAYNIAEYGYALYQEGKFHDSRTVFEALVLANPYDPYFHNMLGAVYQQLDMNEEAYEEYTTALELDGEALHAYVNRGELLMQRGDFERGLRDLRRAIELDPEGKDDAGIRARALAAATVRALEEIDRIVKES